MNNNLNWAGKDGCLYGSWQEKRKADVKWEQQEKQNKLLQEQNNLMRMQQEEARRIEFEQKNAKIEEQKKILQENMTNISFNYINDNIFPEMIKAGIKNPDIYTTKLMELYAEVQKEEKIKLEKIDTNIIDRKTIYDQKINLSTLAQYPLNIKNEIIKINQLCTNLKWDWFTCFGVAFSIAGIIFGSFFLFEDITIGIIILIVSGLLGFCSLKSYKSPKKIKHRKEKEKEIIEKIDTINKEIEEYNKNLNPIDNVKEEKIKKLEQRRLKDFNYLLEFNLEKLGEILSKIDLNEKIKYNFKLRYNPYPSDYESKKEEYQKQQEEIIKINQRKIAEEQGTEIFEDL